MKIYFNLTDEAISNYLKEGIELSKEQSTEINFSDLSKEDREIILRHCVIKNDGLLAGYFKKNNKYSYFNVSEKKDVTSLDGIEPCSIINTFKRFEKEYAEKQENEKARIISDINEFLTGETMKVLGSGIYSDFSGNFDFPSMEKEYKDLFSKYGELPVTFEEIKEKAKEYSDLQEKQHKIRLEKIAKKEAQKEAAKKIREQQINELLNWAKNNGSELLKMRIKHNQNWQKMAEKEWALAQVTGFEYLEEDEDEFWLVENATLEQLIELEQAQKENPDLHMEITRCKYYGDDYADEYTHRTFIRCFVQTPINTHISLDKEIIDVDDL